MRTLWITSTLFLLSSGTLLASHPQPFEPVRVQAVAHDLEEAARHVHQAAEARRHHYDRAESYAFAQLHALESETRHFHRQVERYRQNPYHTVRDYYELREAYVRAARALPALHGDPHVRRDFERVSYLMSVLDDWYRSDRGAGRFGPHEEPRGRGHFFFEWLFDF